jgi:hypothetical protein
MNEPKPYPLVVKRVFFEQFARGEKTIEYRRHRRPFTANTYWPGRSIVIRYSYDPARSPELAARVARFEVARLDETGDVAAALRTIYPQLADADEIALIHLEVSGRP